MLATLIRHRLDKIIETYGTDVELLSTGEVMVCSDTGSSYDVLEIMDFDSIGDMKEEQTSTFTPVEKLMNRGNNKNVIYRENKERC